MSWLKLSLPVTAEEHEALETRFEDLGAAALTLVPLEDAVPWEPAPGDHPVAPRNRLEVLFALDEDLSSLVRAIRSALPRRVLAELELEFLGDEDWQARALAQAVRARFGDRLWLLPKGAPPEPGPTVRLDPGLAFGTGGHPTTRLCLTALAMRIKGGEQVLDYGCGSGILAIAALKLGAAAAVAVDYDPQALVATTDNAHYNALSPSQLATKLPEELAETERFDLLVANILANPLIELAPTLEGHLRPGGQLLLAGLLQEQGSAVRAAYPQIDFEADDADAADGDWLCLRGRRR